MSKLFNLQITVKLSWHQIPPSQWLPLRPQLVVFTTDQDSPISREHVLDELEKRLRVFLKELLYLLRGSLDDFRASAMLGLPQSDYLPETLPISLDLEYSVLELRWRQRGDDVMNERYE